MPPFEEEDHNQRHDPFIHRLPVEIAFKNFTTYVDDIDSAFDVYNAKRLEDWPLAMHLSSICVTWRKLPDVQQKSGESPGFLLSEIP